MTELSLFSGIGGGCLASKLLGHTLVGYVEANEYCRQILQARIRDGYLDDAPVFDDVRTFPAELYCRRVDLVSAGFPCQPFSVAGARRGKYAQANMWPDTLDTIKTIQPRYAFFENVPGLFTNEYFGEILEDLEKIGFELIETPRIISAGQFGAPHLRKRLWWLAANSNSDGLQKKKTNAAWKGVFNDRRSVWWESERGVSRMDDGDAYWMDRTKALGNAQVPIVAAVALKFFIETDK